MLADIGFLYYIITLLCGIFVWFWKRDICLSLMTAYCFFILAVTLLSRSAYTGIHFQPSFFWSWTVPAEREQIQMNIIGFIPVGILGAKRIKWKIVPATAGFSLLIELLQLITQRGLFEFDDVIHNTLGTIIGLLIFMLINKSFHMKD